MFGTDGAPVSRKDTAPRPAMRPATSRWPAMRTERVQVPGRTTWPGSSAMPKPAMLLASQATPLAGWPRIALVLPVCDDRAVELEIGLQIVEVEVRRILALGPSTTRALEPLSATVSCSLMRQSTMRESITSKHTQHVVRGVEHVRDGDARPAQPLAQHERGLDFDLRIDQLAQIERRASIVHHRVEQVPVVGLADAEQFLHRLRGEADLVADDLLAARDAALRRWRCWIA